MTEIETITGRHVCYAGPTPDQIAAEDIAASLARQARFLGHYSGVYTVAQHSCFVHDLLVKWGCSPWVRLAGLLHDAAEAYMGDIPSPLKHMPQLAGYRQIEAGMETMIRRHFGISAEAWRWPNIKTADHAACWAERKAGTFSRGAFAAIPCPPVLVPPVQPCWNYDEARQKFLHALESLMAAGVGVPERSIVA